MIIISPTGEQREKSYKTEHEDEEVARGIQVLAAVWEKGFDEGVLPFLLLDLAFTDNDTTPINVVNQDSKNLVVAKTKGKKQKERFTDESNLYEESLSVLADTITTHYFCQSKISSRIKNLLFCEKFEWFNWVSYIF